MLMSSVAPVLVSETSSRPPAWTRFCLICSIILSHRPWVSVSAMLIFLALCTLSSWTAGALSNMLFQLLLMATARWDPHRLAVWVPWAWLKLQLTKILPAQQPDGGFEISNLSRGREKKGSATLASPHHD